MLSYILLALVIDWAVQEKASDDDEKPYTLVANILATEGERNGLKRPRSDETNSTSRRGVRPRHLSKSTLNPRSDGDNPLALEDPVRNGLSLNSSGISKEGLVLEIASRELEGYILNVSPSDFVYASACKFSSYQHHSS